MLDLRREEVIWTKLSQPSGKPWVCKFNVSLKMDDTDFSKLRPDVQHKVKNLHPDSAFSVQQLYLDLNTAGLQSAPDFAGLKPNSDAYFYLTKFFLNTYWQQLRDAGGDVVLGYTVKPLAQADRLVGDAQPRPLGEVHLVRPDHQSHHPVEE